LREKIGANILNKIVFFSLLILVSKTLKAQMAQNLSLVVH